MIEEERSVKTAIAPFRKLRLAEGGLTTVLNAN